MENEIPLWLPESCFPCPHAGGAGALIKSLVLLSDRKTAALLVGVVALLGRDPAA